MNNTLRVIVLMVLLISSGCVTYFGHDGPYKGIVIDKETSQPIEGAVVDGDWYQSNPGPGGSSGSYLDSRETVTDKNGEFNMPGQGLLILSNIEPVYLTVFKAGYSHVSNYIWAFSNDPSVELRNNKAIIRINKLTMEERQSPKRWLPNQPAGPRSKHRQFLLEYNKEMQETGEPATSLRPLE